MTDMEDKLSEALGQSDQEDATKSETTEVVAPSKIKVGEEEYSQDELQRLVGLGKIGVEAEEKYNTKLDKVWPEYTKAQNDKKDLQSKLDELSTKISENKDKVDEGDMTPDQAVKEAKEAARKLGIVLNEDLGKTMQDSFKSFYQEERAAERLLETVRGFEKDIDGTDGRPAFKAQEVLEYMESTGIKNPEKAYKDKYEKELDSWKEQQLKKIKKPGLDTSEGSSAGSSKSPTEGKVDRNNLNLAIREALQ